MLDVAVQLTELDAVAQAQLVRSGEVSASELVDAAIDRISDVDSGLNAVIHQRFDAARAEAAGALPDGPFRGVPLLLKDLNCWSANDPLHNGCEALKRADHRADHDSAFVTRLRAAGFVIVGRTNVPEFGASITTEPDAHGPTHNPWATGHSSGGSSGGSATAVAARMVPVAHANDAAGSIRIPAGWCGVVGLKPTRGRVSQAPDAGDPWGIGAPVDGVISRSIRDAAAVLDCMTGAEPGDPYAAPPLEQALVDEVGRDPGRLRIGVLDHPLVDGTPTDPDAARAARQAGELLSSLGHNVEASHPAALEDPGFREHFFVLMAVAVATDVAIWGRQLGRAIDPTELEPRTVALADRTRSISAPQYAAAIDWTRDFTRRVASWWSDDRFDVLVTPVTNGAAPELGRLIDPDTGMDLAMSLWQYTAQFNATGQPAIALPLHQTVGGLPVGVQLVGGFGREDVLIRLAAQIEQARPWNDRVPQL
jgi:amidase